jgi:transcriptional regulator with XRE-family HTH domain
MAKEKGRHGQLPLAPEEAVLSEVIHVGWLIRSLRGTLLQPHNGRPWTQDDLAVVIGTDTAHISRIEMGQVQPSRATLERIATALEVTADQRRVLFGLAGYTPKVVPPTDGEIRRTVAQIDALVHNYLHPVTVITCQLLWVYANPAYLRANRLSEEEYRARYLGKTLPEVYAITTDQDYLIAWHWMNILRILWDTSGADYLAEAVRTLLANERFRDWWRENTLDVLSGRAVPTSYEMRSRGIPGERPLHFHRWWSHDLNDRRFIIRQDIPADDYSTDFLIQHARSQRIFEGPE